jgi:hypothetical protein
MPEETMAGLWDAGNDQRSGHFFHQMSSFFIGNSPFLFTMVVTAMNIAD